MFKKLNEQHVFLECKFTTEGERECRLTSPLNGALFTEFYWFAISIYLI